MREEMRREEEELGRVGFSQCLGRTDANTVDRMSALPLALILQDEGQEVYRLQ